MLFCSFDFEINYITYNYKDLFIFLFCNVVVKELYKHIYLLKYMHKDNTKLKSKK